MKRTNQSAHFGDFWVLESKLTKFLSFLKQQIGFSSNFASLFSIMKHNSSVLFYLKFYIFSTQHKEPIKVQIWWNFTWAVENLKICTLIGSFVHSMKRFRWKKTKQLCFMTLKSNARFEEKLTCSFKYNIRNLGNFNPATQKSENFTSLGYLCPKHIYAVWAKKNTEEPSFMTLNSDAKLNKLWPCGFKNDMRNWVNFH